ncbi:MAG: TIGR02597 family protein, partial [Verrucomicrobiota bacterium]
MNAKFLTFTLVALVALYPIGASGQLTTEPKGFNRIECPEGSDTIVSIPFTRTAAFSGTVNLVPTGSLISVTGSDFFAAGEFTTKPHYLRFTEGAVLAGSWYEITANDANTITIDTRGEDISTTLRWDPFEVIPHWTLSTVWPADSQTSLHLSNGKLLSGRGSSVLFADTSTGGTDLAPNLIFF